MEDYYALTEMLNLKYFTTIEEASFDQIKSSIKECKKIRKYIIKQEAIMAKEREIMMWTFSVKNTRETKIKNTN